MRLAGLGRSSTDFDRLYGCRPLLALSGCANTNREDELELTYYYLEY